MKLDRFLLLKQMKFISCLCTLVCTWCAQVCEFKGKLKILIQKLSFWGKYFKSRHNGPRISHFIPCHSIPFHWRTPYVRLRLSTRRSRCFGWVLLRALFFFFTVHLFFLVFFIFLYLLLRKFSSLTATMHSNHFRLS